MKFGNKKGAKEVLISFFKLIQFILSTTVVSGMLAHILPFFGKMDYSIFAGLASYIMWGIILLLKGIKNNKEGLAKVCAIFALCIIDPSHHSDSKT